MAEGLLLRGGRAIDPGDGQDALLDVLIQDGRIAALGPDLEAPNGVRTIDVSGLVVCPGFVDLHVHLRFPGQGHKETMETGTSAAAAGGFTTVCAMANTQPPVDGVETLRTVEREAARVSPVRVRQLSAVTVGLGGTTLVPMAEMAEAGAVAFSDDGKPITSPTVMRLALETAGRLGKVISVHEEDPAVVGSGVANAGVAENLGLPPWPCRGEAGMAVRDVDLLRGSGGRLHIAHVSCAETVEAVRQAKALGLPVTAEVTPHHLRLTDQLLDGDASLGFPPAHPSTKVNPPLRSRRDVEAVVAALADGTIDAIATDHAPHAAGDKDGPYTGAAFGISGIETALPLALDLVRSGHISLPTLLHRLTAGPARCFDLPTPSLAPGSVADIVVFDPDREWRLIPDALHSRGKNTPLLGAGLRGQVLLTLVAGKIVQSRWGRA